MEKEKRCERIGERKGRTGEGKVEGMGGRGRNDREVKESQALQFCQLESSDIVSWEQYPTVRPVKCPALEICLSNSEKVGQLSENRKQ